MRRYDTPRAVPYRVAEDAGSQIRGQIVTAPHRQRHFRCAATLASPVANMRRYIPIV